MPGDRDSRLFVHLGFSREKGPALHKLADSGSPKLRLARDPVKPIQRVGLRTYSFTDTRKDVSKHSEVRKNSSNKTAGIIKMFSLQKRTKKFRAMYKDAHKVQKTALTEKIRHIR